jgi:PadR family transcriptional regulator PadR
MPERITKTLMRVVDVLAEDPTREWYGLELMGAAHLSSGTLYPILHRLVQEGWLVRTRDVASTAGGAGRRMYRLTGVGEHAVVELSHRTASERHVSRPRIGVQPA